MLGFDYTERIPPTALKAAGCQVVFRYVTQPGWPKSLTLAEANELLDAGIAIVLNYETTADMMLAGYSGGVAAAQYARSYARALMAPATSRIYYSADFDVQPNQVSTVLDFLSGASAADGKGEVGDYGGLRMVLAAGAAGYPEWQTVAWSGGQWARNAVAQQTGEQRTVGGVVVDVNNILDFNALGAWTRGTPVMSGTIPAGVRTLFPEVADQFNGTFDDSTAIIYGDAGSRASYVVSKEVLAAVNALSARLGQVPAVDVNALAAALIPHLNDPANADAIAAKVAKLFGNKLAV